MPMWRACRLFIALVVACFVGCGGTAEEWEQGSSLANVEQASGGGIYDRPPPNGLNGTSPSCFWAHGTQQALRSMGSAALDQGAGFLPSFPLNLVSESCRHVFRSAVECALTPAQSVRDPVTGALYTGWWGLAPSWLGDVLDTAGRRYVTACMVQRLNFYGASVPILFEGAHPAIAHSTTYASQYPIEESTVFGDLFSSSTPLLGLLPAFNVFVCWESLLPQSCGLLGLPLLEKRICDDAPLCGLLPVGPCALSCEGSGPYWKCRPFLLAPLWTETVRVKLETSSCQ
ncbi:hypothetical protein CYFUS_003192 [Cystobacter fuscus]|uniref:Lipoprotein n=1 Tax=Cystobacter fuscus TaxID=43 RepID=A0A250J2P7_9BACT|nr:hypothetical protein [Cystobacter fuscus]ATB37767.1 hypothetical protein CYFUS_003192 [Cystobacter fuscus]